MIKNLILAFIHCHSLAFNQTIQLDTITMENQSNFLDNPDQRLPIFNLGNEKIDSILNDEVLSFFDVESDSIEQLGATAEDWSDTYRGSCNYEITYLKNGILSYHLYFANAFGNLNGTIYRYNHSYKTGKSLKLEDIIDSTSNFYQQIQKDLLDNLEKEYPSDFADSTNKNFNEYYSCWEPGYYEECKENLNTENFVVSDKGIEIINNFRIREDCHFQAIFSIKSYSWEEIGDAFIKQK